ncbi:hypothetical protein, partial [Pseudomonas aeruginosa]
MFSKHDQLQGYDDELLAAMDAEDRRQEDHIRRTARRDGRRRPAAGRPH